MARKALISLVEPRMSGYRVAQVEDADNIFDVAQGLYWIDCDDTIVADKFWYDGTNKTFNVFPDPDAGASGV